MIGVEASVIAVVQFYLTLWLVPDLARVYLFPLVSKPAVDD